MTIPPLSAFHYVKAREVTTQLSVKVGALDGKPPLPRSPGEHEDEELYRGDFQQTYADLRFSCYVVSECVPITLPVSTSYRAFSSRWQWGERLSVPIRICDLPPTATLICEVREVVGSRGDVVVGGAAVPLFNSDGVLQCGLVDVKIHSGVSSPVELISLCDALRDTQDGMTLLAKLVKQHHRGEIEKVDWLDRLTFREVEVVNEKSKRVGSSFHLTLEFPPVRCKDNILSVLYLDQEEEVETQNNELCPIHDPEVLLESLVEQKQHKLSRSLRNGPEAKSIKPNPFSKKQLSQILEYPPTRHLMSDEQDLLWTYRYYLTRFKKGLTKFMKCIDWEDEAEVQMAVELVELWEPIDVEDALGLLSSRFHHTVVRSYAVKRLQDANDDDLRLYLLQLVQALKFEVNIEGKISPLGEFLVQRACNNHYFGNFFYWYLVVECEDDGGNPPLYRSVLQRYSKELLKRGDKGEKQRAVFRQQHNLIVKIKALLANLGKDARPKKIEALIRGINNDPELVQFDMDIPLPLDPTIQICGLIPEKATLFKSSLMPAKLTFRTVSGGEYVTIFKNGDDLRQDQLILQVIELMDKLMCKENLNLKLKPYKALATGATHGFIQFVESVPVAHVTQTEGNILSFFKKNSRDKNVVEPDIMDTYIRSCAGYCVITYLLGIGDRHLDNLMLTKQGHLFHIDFGFILGRDPKPFPPPMKLSKEMVEAMGGVHSEEYSMFREHCFNAFLILRRSASLILNLFSLMLEANIPDIAIDPDQAVRKVQDKFCLDLSEEEAVQLFQQLIDESVSALFSALMENIHKWAQYWRR